MLDILIINGTVIDGSGAPAHKGCIGIKDGKLVEAAGNEAAARVIDARGHVVCPGFIDAHSHGDRLLGTEDGRLFKTPQGITTEQCGNCGTAQAPVAVERAEELQRAFSPNVPVEEVRRWASYDAYLQHAEKCQKSANVRFYVGHRILRQGVMGMDNRAPSKAELERMCAMLREAMKSGAAGMSTGLIYVPACYAQPDEIIALAKVMAPFGGIYASHMRNEAEGLIASVRETIDVGRQAGTRVCISHHKVLGKPNWGAQKETLQMIAKANAEGVHVTCDQYPYTRNMTSLYSCMPNWHFSNGMEAVAKKLRDPAFRVAVRAEMEDPASPYDNYYLNAGGWDGVYITSMPITKEAAGMFVSEYARRIGKDPWEAYFDLMADNGCRGVGVYCSMCDEDVCDIIRSPYCVVGTDGINTAWNVPGHPRGSSAFTHAINYFVKEKKILTLEEMIHKMTGLTAERLRFAGKGLLKVGCDADVLVFDFDILKDLATYDDPNRLTEGMDHVIVGGRCVYENGALTGEYSGKVLRLGR